ncbi:single-stranded DNA-binding protein [Rurimicrobium arvi]|uniref:Single-stranded DNA-binding protein n=2 Tax=Rurimicrobium arvi TaxID=2049916 RepID=A0ABP8N1N2_9BACT
MKNRVTLVGNVGQAPEVRTIANGRKMARLSVATNERYKNNQDEWVNDTQWHNIVAWGKQAEAVEQKLSKGDEVMIEGKLVHSEYTDKEGIKRYSTDIELHGLLLLDKKQSGS